MKHYYKTAPEKLISNYLGEIQLSRMSFSKESWKLGFLFDLFS